MILPETVQNIASDAYFIPETTLLLTSFRRSGHGVNILLLLSMNMAIFGHRHIGRYFGRNRR